MRSFLPQCFPRQLSWANNIITNIQSILFWVTTRNPILKFTMEFNPVEQCPVCSRDYIEGDHSDLDEGQREALNMLLALSTSEVMSRCCQGCFMVVSEYASCLTRDAVQQSWILSVHYCLISLNNHWILLSSFVHRSLLFFMLKMIVWEGQHVNQCKVSAGLVLDCQRYD